MRGNTLSPYERLQGVGLNATTMTGNAGATYGGAGNQAYGALGSGLYNAYGSASQGATGAYGAAGAGASNAYGALGTGTYNALGGYGAGASEAMLGGANARASGYVGGANAISGGISNLSNMYYQNQLLNMLGDRKTLPGYPTSSYEGSNPYGYGSWTSGGSPNF
jgi:hypothetical protein